jgi:hypothetical protein
MNRVTRGTVVLAAALVVMSCAGDPMGDLQNGADHLVATPSVLYLNSGANSAVVVEVVDKQGNHLESSFAIEDFDAGLDVQEDTLYNNVYNNKGVLVQPSKWTRARFLITATAGSGDLGFTVKADGKSLRIPVRVLPLDMPVTFSNTAPGPSEEVTITAPAGFLFEDTARVYHGNPAGEEAFITSRAADGSSVTFISYPGAAAGVLTLTGVEVSFLPGLKLDLPTGTSMTPPPAFAGTDAFATAPSFTMPTTGNSATLVDLGAFNPSNDCQNVNPGGWDCRIYTFTIPATVTLDFTAMWADMETDLGLYFDDVGHTDPFTHACDSHGDDGVPEVCSVTFSPGTYFMQMTTYSVFYPHPEPAWFRIDVTAQ